MTDEELQEMVDLLRDSTGVDVAAIAVLDGEHLHYPVVAGTDPFVNPVDDAICRHALGVDGVMAIDDLSADERTKSLACVDGRTGAVRFYASAPLHGPEGQPVGRLCLFDHQPRTLEAADRRLLGVLARNLDSVLDLRLREAEPSMPSIVDTARLVHELRNPLVTLQGSLDMARELVGADEESVEGRLLAMSVRSAHRLGELVDAVLRLARRESPVMGTVDLGEILQQVREDLREQLLENRVRLVDEGLMQVEADPDQMHVVLSNLVSNACKFTRPGVDPQVRLRSLALADRWRVEVDDNGSGVPLEHAEQVFQLFRRFSDVEGHGIGLSTVAAIVQAHGGAVGVEPRPQGPGARFWFEIPYPTSRARRQDS